MPVTVARGDFVQNHKRLPDRQCRADCDHKIAVGDTKLIIPVSSQLSRSNRASGSAVDINSKSWRWAASVSAPMLRVPVLLPPFPGAMFAPALTVTAPLIVPVPPRVVPALLTVTAPLPGEPVLFTRRVPPFTVVPRVKVSFPVRVNVPLPSFVRVEPLATPAITPEISVSPVPFTVRPLPPRAMCPTNGEKVTGVVCPGLESVERYIGSNRQRESTGVIDQNAGTEHTRGH